MHKMPFNIHANAQAVTRQALQLFAEVKNGKAYIKIVGEIYQWNQNSSYDFQSKIDEIIASGVKDAHLYIKSPGGDAFEAAEIANIIERFEGTITGEGGSIVASAATYIAAKCATFSMAANGQFMIHMPYGGLYGNIKEVKAKTKALENVTNDYLAMYAKKTGMSTAEIEALWQDGDCWMSAQEALDKKFIDSIGIAAPIKAEDISMIRACGAPLVPKITATTQTIQKPNSSKMNELQIIATALGMSDSSTLANVMAKIDELKGIKAQHDALILAQANESKRKKADEFKALFDKCVTEKKITEDYRASFEAKFNANEEAATQELNALKPVNKMEIVGGAATSKIVAERKDWKYSDWAEKDPKGLNALVKQDPAAFKALYLAHYNVEAPAAMFN